MANRYLPLAERLWSKVERSDGCWLFTGVKWPNGYGQIRDKNRYRVASRVAYELTYGSLPPKMQVDHLCRNRACCRPDHLEAVTNRTNVLRGVGITATAARRTSCSRGHPYAPENVRFDRKGKRVCLMCRRIYAERS